MILGIFGASGLGREVEIVARKINTIEKRWEQIVFIDDNNEIHDVLGRPCLRYNEAREKYNNLEISIAIGEPMTRSKIYSRVKNDGIKLATLIHPGVLIDDSTRIGEGVTICEGTTVTSCTTIEDNVYIQPRACVGHDIRIGKHSTIGSHAVIGGGNNIGERVFMGFLSGTIQGLTIGDDAEIAAGAIVFRDVEPRMIVMGNPAKVIRRNEGRGVYTK